MTSDLPRCYVASPLGFNDAGRSYYYEHYLPALAAVAEPIDPWSTSTLHEIESARRNGQLRDLWLRVGRHNLDAIASADVLVAWLDGQEVDSGTCIEVGYAAARGVTCFGLRTDLRRAGEAEMAVNVQVEATIVSTGGRIVNTLEELVGCVQGVAG